MITMDSRPDVDIEVQHRDRVAALFSMAIPASQIVGQPDRQKLALHRTGLHFQKIPRHPISGFAAFPYEEAEVLGYYKIDLLSASVYDDFASQDDLRAVLAQPINWEWFKNVDFVSTLFHMHENVYLPGEEIRLAEVVAAYAPRSIPDLAIMLAVKLPAKKHLIGESWETLREAIWVKEKGGKAQFKRSHATAYSVVVGLDARIKAPGFFALEEG